MRYEIVDHQINSILKIKLAQGEEILAEAGSMMYMNSGMNVSTDEDVNSSYSSLNHYAAAQHAQKTKFYCDENQGAIVFSPSSPGRILHFDLNNESIVADGLSFLCGSNDLEYDRKGSVESLLSGAGKFVETVSGTGNLFLKCFGDITKLELGEGEKVAIDIGHLLAYDPTVTSTILKNKEGRFDAFAEGEMLVNEFYGPGRIWLQTRNRSEFAKVVQTYLPRKSFK